MTDNKMERYKVKKAIKDLVKNINETTHIPVITEDDVFELFQLDSVADLRKVSRNFLKLSKILDYFSTVTEIATSEKEGIVKFGIENGNAVDVKDWIKGIGGVIGGYVSKVSNKEAGKWYLNDLTDGKIYKCIQNHTSTSFDTTKYLDISNYGLSDKVENLYRVQKHDVPVHGGGVNFKKYGKVVVVSVEIQRENITFTENSQLINSIPDGFKPNDVSLGIESALASNLTSGKQGATRMRIERNSLNVWGCHTGNYNVLKGSLTYFTDN